MSDHSDHFKTFKLVILDFTQNMGQLPSVSSGKVILLVICCLKVSYGFGGANCEVNIDDCRNHRCQNGATCIVGVKTYNCQCPPEWTGQFCTDDVDECSLLPNVCQNGGTCSNTRNGYNCVCVNGWSGPDCSENIDDCAAEPCTAGSTCIDRVASFRCSCPPGKTGLLCHIDDACTSNPCKMGAQCYTNPINGKFNCNCPSGYKGSKCAEDIDECVIGPNPCEHGGSCKNTVGSFTCSCAPGYTGPHCETSINVIPTPARMTPTCLDQIGDFTCSCIPVLQSWCKDNAAATPPRDT
ncbi:neurogenic locus notch homolog protein 1 isoform X1 [Cyprinus carpio]|uniref:Neurogenic locus notch homolog protein 1 isoform X1 n=1 Tax=Cyprinus carpio TaxID=7962 RepID=A0A9R0A4N8_CYPCA|nr:neurogenic locus notch homolog protein 1 isoform X1 [Cyprinus carpio]